MARASSLAQPKTSGEPSVRTAGVFRRRHTFTPRRPPRVWPFEQGFERPGRPARLPWAWLYGQSQRNALTPCTERFHGVMLFVYRLGGALSKHDAMRL